MEDEDFRVEVGDLDKDRLQEVVGVAAVTEVALELGDVPVTLAKHIDPYLSFNSAPTKISSTCKKFINSHTEHGLYSLGRPQLLPSAERVEPRDVVDVRLFIRLLRVRHIFLPKIIGFKSNFGFATNNFPHFSVAPVQWFSFTLSLLSVYS